MCQKSRGRLSGRAMRGPKLVVAPLCCDLPARFPAAAPAAGSHFIRHAILYQMTPHRQSLDKDKILGTRAKFRELAQL